MHCRRTKWIVSHFPWCIVKSAFLNSTSSKIQGALGALLLQDILGNCFPTVSKDWTIFQFFSGLIDRFQRWAYFRPSKWTGMGRLCMMQTSPWAANNMTLSWCSQQCAKVSGFKLHPPPKCHILDHRVIVCYCDVSIFGLTNTNSRPGENWTPRVISPKHFPCLDKLTCRGFAVALLVRVCIYTLVLCPCPGRSFDDMMMQVSKESVCKFARYLSMEWADELPWGVARLSSARLTLVPVQLFKSKRISELESSWCQLFTTCRRHNWIV